MTDVVGSASGAIDKVACIIKRCGSAAMGSARIEFARSRDGREPVVRRADDGAARGRRSDTVDGTRSAGVAADRHGTPASAPRTSRASLLRSSADAAGDPRGARHWPSAVRTLCLGTDAARSSCARAARLGAA